MSDLTHLTADEIQQIADQFAHFANVYAQIAEEIRTKKMGFIEVKGVSTMNYAIERITGSVGSAQKAVMNRRKIVAKAVSPKSMVAEETESYSVKVDAAKQTAKPTARKKKKPSR